MANRSNVYAAVERVIRPRLEEIRRLAARAPGRQRRSKTAESYALWANYCNAMITPVQRITDKFQAARDRSSDWKIIVAGQGDAPTKDFIADAMKNFGVSHY